MLEYLSQTILLHRSLNSDAGTLIWFSIIIKKAESSHKLDSLVELP